MTPLRTFLSTALLRDWLSLLSGDLFSSITLCLIPLRQDLLLNLGSLAHIFLARLEASKHQPISFLYLYPQNCGAGVTGTRGMSGLLTWGPVSEFWSSWLHSRHRGISAAPGRFLLLQKISVERHAPFGVSVTAPLAKCSEVLFGVLRGLVSLWSLVSRMCQRHKVDVWSMNEVMQNRQGHIKTRMEWTSGRGWCC